jgi:hypothetical protein
MNRGFLYWLRWLAVLPVATIASALSLVPLHFVLYRTLIGFVEPYPELPETLLSFPTMTLGFVWVGARIAPSHKVETAIALFGLVMIGLGGFLFLGLFTDQWFVRPLFSKGHGIGAGLGFASGLATLYFVRQKQREGSQ